MLRYLDIHFIEESDVADAKRKRLDHNNGKALTDTNANAHKCHIHLQAVKKKGAISTKQKQ